MAVNIIRGIAEPLETCQFLWLTVNKWKKLLPFFKSAVLNNISQTCRLLNKPQTSTPGVNIFWN